MPATEFQVGDLVIPIRSFKHDMEDDDDLRRLGYCRYMDEQIGVPCEVMELDFRWPFTCYRVRVAAEGARIRDVWMWPEHYLAPANDKGEPETLFDAYVKHQMTLDLEKAARRAQLRTIARERVDERLSALALQRVQDSRPSNHDRAVPPRHWYNLKYYRLNRAYNRTKGQFTAMCLAVLRDYPDRMDVLSEVYWHMMRDNIPHSVRKHPAGATLALLHSKYSADFYVEPVWGSAGFVNLFPETLAHCVHVSETDPMKVAYYPTMRHLREGRCVTTSPGKYLTKWASVTAIEARGLPRSHLALDELAIKRLAEKHRLTHGPAEVKWARTPEECIRAIAEGPTESCMSNGYYDSADHEDHTGERDCYVMWRGHVHPAAVYGSTPDCPTDTAVAYLENEDGVVTARVVVNTRAKKMARGYGDHTRIVAALEKEGYKQVSMALAGCRIRRIKDKNGPGYIMPYVDAGTGPGGGYLRAMEDPDDDRYWVLDAYSGVSTYHGYTNHGVTEYVDEDEHTVVCGHCGESYNAEDGSYSEYHDRDLCPYCRDRYYTWACVDRRNRDWIRDDQVITDANGESYATEEVAAEHNVYQCEYTGNYYPDHALVSTDRGMVNYDAAVALDVEDSEGNCYAYPGEEGETFDGRVCLASELRVFSHNGHDYLIHKDDDPADFAEFNKENETEEDEPVAA